MLIEKFEVHDSLNPSLWKENELRVDVKEHLLDIVDQFIQSCSIPLHVADIRLVGSQASFNYTETSDLDVHIVSNFNLVSCDESILKSAYDAIKTNFNNSYNFTIKNIPVELYVEDMNSMVRSNGIYSILHDTWISFPRKIIITEPDYSKELSLFKSKIQDAIESENSETISNIIDELYLLRKDSLASDGEYGKLNLLFKELRSIGLLDELKTKYKEFKSKELSLESLQRLNEATRSNLISKSKQSNKGFERFKKRVKSRVANSVKQYNAIDMNKLFKENILDVSINVKGETDDYIVKISFGNFLDCVHDELKKQQKDVIDYKVVTRALITAFNSDDVYISCNCADWQYRFNYYATKNNITSGDPETRPSDITNPEDTLGSACKHVLLVLSNTSWLLKVSSTVYNYTRYMQKHYQKLFANIIYPALYEKEYEEPVQLDVFDDDTLDSDSETIDKSNDAAVQDSRFKQGNTQGVRFAPKTNQEDNQLTIDDE